MSAFSAFMFWMVMCWLVYLCRVEPLQPDQDTDVDEAYVELPTREINERLFWQAVDQHSDIVTPAQRMAPRRQYIRSVGRGV